MALAASLAFVVAIQWNGQTKESDGNIARDVGDDRQATPFATGEIPFFQAEGILADTDWKNPLDQEIEHVLSDAKGAVGFLAESFLPSTVFGAEQEG